MESKYVLALLLFLTSCATNLKPVNNCKNIEEFAVEQGIILVKTGYQFERTSKILDKICKKLSIAKKQCTLVILDTPKIITPFSNKYGVILTRGLVESVAKDNYLAFILGHELSHIKLLHNNKKTNKCMIDSIKILLSYPSTMSNHLNDYGGFGATYDRLKNPGYAVGAVVLYGIGSAVKYGLEEPLYSYYDHKKEYDADVLSIKTIKAIGYKTKNLELFFPYFEKLLGGKRYRSTHPYYKDRLKKLEKYF